MWSAGGWRYARRRWRHAPWRGRRIIRCLPMLISTALLASACARTPGPSRYRPTVPVRPEFSVQPKRFPCVVNGTTGECVAIWSVDWTALGIWSLSLERELRASCLALGGSPAECRVASPP